MMPVRLSVMEVHWRIIANLGSDLTLPRIGRCAAAAAVLLAGESSRAMLASARVMFITEYMWIVELENLTVISTCRLKPAAHLITVRIPLRIFLRQSRCMLRAYHAQYVYKVWC